MRPKFQTSLSNICEFDIDNIFLPTETVLLDIKMVETIVGTGCSRYCWWPHFYSPNLPWGKLTCKRRRKTWSLIDWNEFITLFGRNKSYACILYNEFVWEKYLLSKFTLSNNNYMLHWYFNIIWYKQRFLTPGHQGWNDLHSLCRIGMEYYLLNNNDNNNNNNNNNNNMMMIMIIIIRMMTMMIIGTTTIMIMIIIITTALTMTIMKMIMIKTAQTPCQSLYKDRHIQNKIAWYNWYNRDDVMLILYEMLHMCSITHTQRRCKFENTKHRCLGLFLHKCNLHCSGRN